LDGTGVKVVIVDTAVNMNYLRFRGKSPGFDAKLRWGSVDGQPLGNMPVDHGTMCAYDVCIAAPACTFIDHPVLTFHTPDGSAIEGLLSDAVQSSGLLLSYLTRAPQPFAGDHTPRTLVINNSWGMFHPSWDFPVEDPQNYSDNPDHPFNIIVGSLEAAGADILFTAGIAGSNIPTGDAKKSSMPIYSKPILQLQSPACQVSSLAKRESATRRRDRAGWKKRNRI
jgi:hypothetical protein